MAKIHSMMDIGKRSMQSSQTALQTVSHNIANKNTEGYSRQRVEVTTTPPHTEGRVQVGTGSRTSVVTRTVNPWLDKQIQREGATNSFLDTKSNALERVEQVFNEQLNKGLNHSMAEYFNSFRELANNPESLANRTMVKESGEVLVRDFKRVATQLDDVTKDLDQQIKTGVDDVNAITKEIAQLNEQVHKEEIGGSHANDARDRRDLLLKKLSEKVNITSAEESSGMLSITAGNTAILVSGTSHSEMSTHRRPGDEKMQIYYSLNENGTKTDVTEQFNQGALGSALQVRDQIVEGMKKSVNELAYNFATEVNKAHIEGYDKYSGKGVLFFDMPDSAQNAATQLQVNKTILNDVGRIAAASQPNSPADNTVANVIHGIQYQNTMAGGTSTFDDFYNSKVGEIGIMTQRTRETADSQKNVVEQLNNIRESISGVSLDEEATKMIEYQKAFEASARVIKMADEMFDTVLNLKRL